MKTSTKLALAVIVFALFAARKARASSSSRLMLLTDANIRRIDSRVRKNYASVLLPAMEAGDIVTGPRMAAFLAQILHESGGFQWLKELAPGTAYEGRQDLGNTQPGDGPRYKGRGFIQLTGRANYRAAGADLGLPLEMYPEIVESPDVAAQTAVWYWTKKRLNSKADDGDFIGITRAINPGLLHQSERERLYNNAKAVFGADGSPMV